MSELYKGLVARVPESEVLASEDIEWRLGRVFLGCENVDYVEEYTLPYESEPVGVLVGFVNGKERLLNISLEWIDDTGCLSLPTFPEESYAHQAHISAQGSSAQGSSAQGSSAQGSSAQDSPAQDSPGEHPPTQGYPEEHSAPPSLREKRYLPDWVALQLMPLGYSALRETRLGTLFEKNLSEDQSRKMRLHAYCTEEGEVGLIFAFGNIDWKKKTSDELHYITDSREGIGCAVADAEASAAREGR